MFSDSDPAVLQAIYEQVGRKKDVLLEVMLNGGVIPEDFIPQEEMKEDSRDKSSEVDLGDLVGVQDEADEITIQRQIAEIERQTKKREERRA